MWEAILALLFGRRKRPPVHDENVHKLHNAAANALASVEIAARQSGRMRRQLDKPEHLEDRIQEAYRLATEMRQYLDKHSDPDDGLLRGMDHSLKKGGEK